MKLLCDREVTEAEGWDGAAWRWGGDGEGITLNK